MEYKQLRTLIKEASIFRDCDKQMLYNEVVKEYEDMEDNPNDATLRDIAEIADASGYPIKWE